ncbi:abortive phage resistance protein [Lysobacter concretionis Ko07 = DSM 16239]|uniref:Abortive phage resistance protein n=1 Tax=Lysobacter concretionis Ko07 = DSM 16239 TaxID=1122185 RepID=A0A0A0EPM6_9GAMM|nr:MULTISPECIES: abortive infection family protein [Lysobacter]KGM52344.1 abortive phage resistance protein [Lysobacter concretionis Ko07 = DSM 16239]QOD91918.1 abortive infection family protein [Lysobacter sp. CW239]
MNELLDQTEALQNLLISQATGGSEDDAEYVRLRQMMLSNAALEPLLPRFLRACRNLSQFWQFIKFKYGTYAERRDYIWGEFNPMLEAVERGALAPSDTIISQKLERFDAAHVQAAWSKALDRRSSDPEGAITSARTLIESVCKHILDGAEVSYDDSADLPKLYRLTAESLNIAPSQHTEQVFKQILGGCTAVVEGLGSLRNRLSDAHGKGKIGKRPAPRHAELSVNLSGALATYLLATWEARSEADA